MVVPKSSWACGIAQENSANIRVKRAMHHCVQPGREIHQERYQFLIRIVVLYSAKPFLADELKMNLGSSVANTHVLMEEAVQSRITIVPEART